MLLFFLLIFLLGIGGLVVFIYTISLFSINIALFIAVSLIIKILAHNCCMNIYNKYSEWGLILTSPPKPHAFVDSSTQSSVFVPMESTLTLLSPLIDELINQWYDILIFFTIKGVGIAFTTTLTAVSTASDTVIDSIQISTPNIHFIPKYNPWLDLHKIYILIFNHAFYFVPILLPVLQSTSKVIYRLNFLSDSTKIFANYKQVLFLHWYRIYMDCYFYIFEEVLVSAATHIMRVLCYINEVLHKRWLSLQHPGKMWVYDITGNSRRTSPILYFYKPDNIPTHDPLLLQYMMRCVHCIQMVLYLLDMIGFVKKSIMISVCRPSKLSESVMSDELAELFALIKSRIYTMDITTEDIPNTIVFNPPTFSYIHFDASVVGLSESTRYILEVLNLYDIYPIFLIDYIYLMLYFW